MSRLGLLHRVKGQRADSVNAKLVEFRSGFLFLLHFRAHFRIFLIHASFRRPTCPSSLFDYWRERTSPPSQRISERTTKECRDLLTSRKAAAVVRSPRDKDRGASYRDRKRLPTRSQ